MCGALVIPAKFAYTEHVHGIGIKYINTAPYKLIYVLYSVALSKQIVVFVSARMPYIGYNTLFLLPHRVSIQI